MTQKTDGFTIRESELAEMLEINRDKLDTIVIFFDSNSDDEWELKENTHFIYLNKSLKERLFSKQGAYAIAKYIEDTQPHKFFARFKEFVTKHREKTRNALINQKIQENCSSLTLKNNRYFLSTKDVISIFCISPSRFNLAFEEIKKTDSPLIIYQDFEDIDGIRHYSFSGLDRLSRHLSEALTVKDRQSWCKAVELVGKKTFKLIIDAETAKQKKIDAAMYQAKKRDKSQCQITAIERNKRNKANITVHHIYDRQHYPHLADCEDNLITLSQEVHNDFHSWNGGSGKSCTADNLIDFVQQLHPDNYAVIMRLNKIKQTLNVK